MEKTPKELMKAYVDSQKFGSTTEIMDAMKGMSCDTPKGADSSAIVYTMVETAKANGLDPLDYRSRLLDEVRYLGKTPPDAFLENLLLWSVQIQKIVKHLE